VGREIKNFRVARPALPQAQFAALQHRHRRAEYVPLPANFHLQQVGQAGRRRSFFVRFNEFGSFMLPDCRKHFFILCKRLHKTVFGVAKTLRVIGGGVPQQK